MDNRPIGVFDSGLGGLTAVRQLMELMPREDIVYFGDTGRVPYGSRSAQAVHRYAREDCRFLQQQGVKFLIAACGTVSSVAGDVLEALPLPAMGIIQPAADAAARATRSRRIGVMGTSTTVRSGSFVRRLHELDPSVEVTAVACPVLVTLVENGWIDPRDEVTIAAVRRYLRPLQEAQVDTVILGCTHFPLLAPLIRAQLGADVTLIDSGRETAAACAARLAAADALCDPQKARGRYHYFVSDRPEGFTQVAETFLGRPVHEEIDMIPPDTLRL